jgi:predicted AlkP superfamily phosphohydrolase/phosphomutase
VVVLCPLSAEAYIGPGAGFAVVTSFFVLFLSFLLAILTLFLWPVRFFFNLIFRRRKPKGKAKRVIIVGLDGFDPDIAAQLMADGKLKNFSELSRAGTFSRLKTSTPSISPVAWSTFMTGVNPGKHNIFDFLSRDPKTYLPDLSSARIEPPRKRINLGKFSIPVEKARTVLLRKSKPFWSLLGERGIFGTVLRVPITFPPEKFNGVLLSGMCVPDLQGSQGTFSHYTSDKAERPGRPTGGTVIRVEVNGGRVESEIRGPQNSLRREASTLTVPFSVQLEPAAGRAVLRLPGQSVVLKPGIPSEWVRLSFKQGLTLCVHGICRFLLRRMEPHFEMYVSPVHIDPEKPALPISHPFVYSIYLAKLLGPYATLGLAEDTWALNEGALDDEAFLEQCYRHHAEREEMLFHAWAKTKHGLLVTVFDTTDRIQHMFWRLREPGRPARPEGAGSTKPDPIEELYVRMDVLIGKVRQKLKKKDVLIILSDHGFKPFRRGVSLNSWLHENGYLALKDGKAASAEWFQDVDWEKTKAYGLGLAGLFLNLSGRESKGIVGPEEAGPLKAEIADGLMKLVDPETGGPVVSRIYDREKVHRGPYVENGPDLIIGYHAGYRVSWDSVTGKVGGALVEENEKCWSGDHCIDPELVPGVFFSNWKLDGDGAPGLVDMAPTVLDLFGVEPPGYMDGKVFSLSQAAESKVK